MSTEQTRDAEAVDLRSIAEAVVDGYGAAPCAVVGAARRTLVPQIVPRPDGLAAVSGWRFGWGSAGRLWRRPPADCPAEAPRAAAHNIFDMASLTKPVTALLLARLQREGILSRDEALGEVLPEVASSASAAATLGLLLAHRAGLEAHREFFVKTPGARQPGRAETLAAAANARRHDLPAGTPPEQGFSVVYSDLGYILVGAAIEQRTGCALDELVQQHVAGPLGLALGSVRQLEATEPGFRQRVVPTEDVPWRGGVLRGIVHDENAWVLAGTGSAGHAGLFGDAWSFVRLGTSILDAWCQRERGWLSQEDLLPLIEVRPGGSHRSGFDGKTEVSREGDSDSPGGPAITTPSSSGQLFGPHSFGHLGFTGTSIWMDPERDLVGVLLSNRVHPSREHVAIRAARPAAYDAICRAMMPAPDGVVP